MTEHYLDRLARTITENWNSPALTDFYLTEDGSAQDTSRGNHYTYGEMYAEILRLGELFAALGLQKGDHIAICGANSAHWAIAYLAIAAYQGVAVTILHSQSPEDIAHQIDFSDANALFTDADLWKELKDQSLPQVEHVISLEDWQILRGEEPKTENRKSKIANREACFTHGNPDELAMICFTSGTTGVSKGVMLSTKNISTNLLFLVKEFTECPLRNSISVLPMAHAGVFVSDIIHLLCRGAKIHIISSFSSEQLLRMYAIVKPQEVVMVPMMLRKLIDSLEMTDNKVLHQCLNRIFGGEFELFCLGGAKIPIEIEQTLQAASTKYAIGYGTTECAPFISLEMPSYIKIGTVGKIAPTLDCRIAPNGEILVKGGNVMLGYYKDPEATSRKIDKDGWLHTGDKGHLDEDGYLYVEGRLDQDMIVLPNGENIHPEDIERKINALPEVRESIVLARDGHLIAIIVPSLIENRESKIERDALRRHVLRTINPELPLYSQLYDVEITDVPLQKTEKQTIKRYLYK